MQASGKQKETTINIDQNDGQEEDEDTNDFDGSN